jgi:hypothetical protein
MGRNVFFADFIFTGISAQPHKNSKNQYITKYQTTGKLSTMMSIGLSPLIFHAACRQV